MLCLFAYYAVSQPLPPATLLPWMFETGKLIMVDGEYIHVRQKDCRALGSRCSNCQKHEISATADDIPTILVGQKYICLLALEVR